MNPCIKGGGGCLAQEKVVAANADLFVVIADDRKRSEELGTSWKYVPIEVLDLAYKPLQATIEVSICEVLKKYLAFLTTIIKILLLDAIFQHQISRIFFFIHTCSIFSEFDNAFDSKILLLFEINKWMPF